MPSIPGSVAFFFFLFPPKFHCHHKSANIYRFTILHFAPTSAGNGSFSGSTWRESTCPPAARWCWSLQKLLNENENSRHHIEGVADVEVAVEANAALRVKKLSPHAILPSRGSALAAGYDLSSAYECMVPAHGKALVKTDLSIAIPVGTYARVAPRSGLAWKHSIDVGAGVIDADYRGPVGVILFNHSDTDFTIQAGDRIAQLILQFIVTPQLLEVEDLDTTTRGEGGFGSTGFVALVIDP